MIIIVDMEMNIKYKKLSDKQLVIKIITPPHEDDAAAYLLRDRYNPLLHKIYKRITNDFSWYDDCVQELFIHLKGKNCDWHSLATFEWRSTFGCWLSGVAKNKFQETLPKLIENRVKLVSIDDDNPEIPKVQLPDAGEEDYERRQLKAILLEAISLLKDDDQRFVALKRLQGYNSREIAELLFKKWKKHDIKKYNNRKELVIPDSGYVDVRMQRAKENLKLIINELTK